MRVLRKEGIVKSYRGLVCPRGSDRLANCAPGAITIGLCLLGVVLAMGADNVNPGNDDSRYAYGENVGWLNAQPLGSGGPGVEVADFELTGWIWSENLGWVSTSCKSTSSCSHAEYGVKNNGQGALSGFAWSENAGWINFAPSTAGVQIDPTTGDFSGGAWGENIGWITFASSGPNPYKITTSWNCDPAPPPPMGLPQLYVDKTEGTSILTWSGDGTGFDLVYGDVDALRTSPEPFAESTRGCIAAKRTILSLDYVDVPPPGDAVWFLARGANCGGSGSYDSDGPSQALPRDGGVVGSSNDCP